MARARHVVGDQGRQQTIDSTQYGEDQRGLHHNQEGIAGNRGHDKRGQAGWDGTQYGDAIDSHTHQRAHNKCDEWTGKIFAPLSRPSKHNRQCQQANTYCTVVGVRHRCGNF